MFIGLNSRTNQRIYIDKAINEPEEEYICPICRGKLIIRNGSIKAHHFAHKADSKCDSFTADMSQWHKDWQNIFPKKNQEVVLSLDITERDYKISSWDYGFGDMTYSEFDDYKYNENIDANIQKNIRHRADVVACGYVIEFQHSSISSREFNERNWFYTHCGYKVIWIFDFIDKSEYGQIAYIDEWSKGKDNGAKYRWNNAVKIFEDFIPQDHKPQYIENEWWKGDVTIFFQLAKEDKNEEYGYIEKVVWAIVDDSCKANYKRFMSSYYPGDKVEFKRLIISRRI